MSTFLLMFEMALLFKYSSRKLKLFVNAKLLGCFGGRFKNFLITFGGEFFDLVVRKVGVVQVGGGNQHSSREFGQAVV